MCVSLKGKHALFSSKVWKQVQERAQRYKNDHNYPKLLNFRVETSSSQYHDIMNVYQYSHYKNPCNIISTSFVCYIPWRTLTLHISLFRFCRKVTYMVLAIYNNSTVIISYFYHNDNNYIDKPFCEYLMLP